MTVINRTSNQEQSSGSLKVVVGAMQKGPGSLQGGQEDAM